MLLSRFVVSGLERGGAVRTVVNLEEIYKSVSIDRFAFLPFSSLSSLLFSLS